jgi:hypothetical protein
MARRKKGLPWIIAIIVLLGVAVIAKLALFDRLSDKVD